MRRLSHLAVVLAAWSVAGCIPAMGARPAAVRPGLTLDVRESLAYQPPSRSSCLSAFGDLACDYPLPMAVDVGLSYGRGNRSTGVGVASVAGTFAPYVEFYRQREGTAHPRGFGVRVGVPVDGWSAHQVEWRGERQSTGRHARVWNTALLAQVGGRSDDARGTILSLVHARGLIVRTRYVTTTPSLFVGVQRAHGVAPSGETLASPLVRFGPAWGLIGGFGGVVTFHRPR